MLKNGQIYPGQPYRFTATFQDQDGDVIDPDTVTLRTRDPYAREASYVYGTDGEVQRVSTGIYYGDITPDQSGKWHIRWETTGNGKTTVIQDSINVIASEFSPYGGYWGSDYT